MRTAIIPAAALIAAASLLIAACGGDSDDQQQQQQAAPQPAAATQPASEDAMPQDREPPAAAQPSMRSMASDDAPSQSARDSAQDAPPVQTAAAATAAPPAGLAPATSEQLSVNPRLELLQEAGYPVYLAGDYIVALGTPDISVGAHRISLTIEGPAGLVEDPALAIAAYPPDGGPARMEAAAFARFPDEVRGFHVASLQFDQPGDWTLAIAVGGENLLISLPVPPDTRAPDIGDPVPLSLNRTLADVEDLADLSTGFVVDALLYAVTVADAVANDLPTVVVFASPGFCTNAFCGPQAEVLSEIRIDRPGQANYIHVDLYENPVEVRLGEAPIHTPLLEEWGLETDEWTFVVNPDGTVAARFEAFAPRAEVEAALEAVLARS